MKWLRNNDVRLMLVAMMLFTVLLLVVSCQSDEEAEVATPTDSAPAALNTCLNCHSDQVQLMALAVEPEVVEAASSGEG